MLVRATAFLVLASLTAGCATEAQETPVLGNPKFLLDRTSTNLTVLYVHSAFGERPYDRLALAVDNETLTAARETYALEHKVALDAFHLRVEATAGTVNYTLDALVRLDGEGALVAVLEEDGYTDPRRSALPWQKLVEETRATEAEA